MKVKPALILVAVVCPLVTGLMMVVLAASAPTPKLHVLSGHVPAAISKLQPIGRVDATQRLNLSIGLPLRNQAQLAEFLNQLYDPTSPNWHHYLTVEQFTEQFGPTTTDYEAVVGFAQNKGFKITVKPSNRMLLQVNATVGQIERAFNIQLHQYRHPAENRLFYAPDAEPSVDAGLSVLHVSGLDNFHLPRPGGHVSPNVDPTKFPAGGGEAGSRAGTGPFGSWRGMDFRNAYVPGTPLTGAGQKLGLLEYDGYYVADITNYAAQSGLRSVPLTNVLIDGFSGIPNTGAGVFEVTLDIQMAASMAPGLDQIIVYESQPGSQGDDSLNQMAVDNAAQQLSSSWSFPPNSTVAQIFQEFAAQGQTFFICSFDNGAFNAAAGHPITVPVDYPYAMVVVGGTVLTTTAGGAWSSETAWNGADGTGTGGGISATFPIPPWQQTVDMSTNGGSTVWRNIPDVACVATHFYVIYNNGHTTVNASGTSFSAPLWAGFTALANQQAASNGLPRLGFLNPLLYQIGQSSFYNAAFHDTTTGNNTNSFSPTNFYATAGYDLCTGWGTPNGTNLINLLAPTLTPVVLSAPKLSNGNFEFTVSGLLFGRMNYLQATADLMSPQNWITIVTNVATNSAMVIGGFNPTNPPVRFFRVVEQP